jgi:toxin ParE1/3/4
MNVCTISPRASRDLEEIHDYIAQGSPRSAARFLETIERKLQTLTSFPQLGPSCEELATNLRCLPVGNYIIFYRPLDNGIEFVRVLHGRRDIKSIFEKESE